MEEVSLKDMGKGVTKDFNFMMKTRPSLNMSRYIKPTKYRMDTAIQAAGTLKNKKIVNGTKTRNNKVLILYSKMFDLLEPYGVTKFQVSSIILILFILLTMYRPKKEKNINGLRN
jgi:hypothetical protein